jgi:signal transduction histidine kinase
MISDFLDAALVESGQLELRMELRDLRDLVRSTADLFAETSSAHRLVLTLPNEACPAWIDPVRIEQVTSNLLSNAIKYSPSGGAVEVRLQCQESECLLSVTDHGLGMSPETRARLFEPFRRGLSREDIPGVGLGLFVVQRIVDAHQGRIEVESSPAAGSTFRVYLPLEGPAPSA